MTEAAQFRLGEEAKARGARLVVFDELDSTNDECKRRIAEGERGPLWVVAARQTKGRGRLGRAWISPAGNLFASLILSGFSPSAAPQLGFVAGVAAIAACRAATGLGERLALKWPNDLLLDGGKLAGVLLEGVSAPSLDPRAQSDLVCVIGVGVNCAVAPQGLPYETRALSLLGQSAPSCAEIFLRLTDCFSFSLQEWSEGRGFAQIRESWLNSAAWQGEGISVSLGNGETLSGQFSGIDATGRLLLKTEDGTRAIDAGDVHLSRLVARQSQVSDSLV